MDDFEDALREFGDFQDGLTEEEEDDFLLEEAPATSAEDDRVFGMTPVQRFVLAVLIFLSICMLGTLCLLVTDKIALPLY